MTFDDYRDAHVLVTGSSSGIGRATAKALTGLGANVHGLDRRDPPDELTSFTHVDLTDPSAIDAAVRQGPERVDRLFNCAGAPPTLPELDIVKVNFLGLRQLTERVVERMPDGGAVVSVSSDGGYGWRKELDALNEFVRVTSFEEGAEWFAEHEGRVAHGYAFGKEALDVWTMQQSAKLISRGIRINTVSPGAVQTPMLEAIDAAFPPEMVKAPEHPSGRRSSPEEQAGPLLFLNSDLASYVNGADLVVDGGYWASLSVHGDLWNV